MTKTRKGASGRQATRDGGVAHVLVVGPDDFARAVAAVRAAKHTTPARGQPAPAR